MRLRCGVREIRSEAAVLQGRPGGWLGDSGGCVHRSRAARRAAGLVPAEWSGPGLLDGLRHLKTSPITSVHFWFDRTVMTEPFLALLDHTTQWIFNKTLLSGVNETAKAPAHLTGRVFVGIARDLSNGQYLQLVISASYDLVPNSRQEIIDLCRRELADVLPATRDAKLRKATVIKEVNATFSPEPGVDRWRPAQDIGMDNLFLREIGRARAGPPHGRRGAQRISCGGGGRPV